MRVHPTAVHTAKAKWHFPAAMVLLVLVLLSNLYKGSRNTASAVPETRMTQVVVAKTTIEPGKPIPKESLALENRPVSTLPPDSIMSIDQVSGKFASGTILPGYPISKPLVQETKHAARVSDEERKQEPNPDAEKVSRIPKETIGLNLTFQQGAPPLGSRIAVAIQGKSGISQIVADEAWVEKILDKQNATIRARHSIALFLQDVKPFGTFSFFLVPEEGPSPFASEVVNDIGKLREKLQIESSSARPTKATTTKSEKKGPRAGDFTNYAWVSGEGVKYSIDQDGKMYVIDRSGAVTPLYNYQMGVPVETEEPVQAPVPTSQIVVPDTSSVERQSHLKRHPGEVRTGLESIFPTARIEPETPPE